MNGKVRTIRADRGFGFAVGEDGKEYFFHSTGVTGVFEDLREGDRVAFDVEASQKGPRANHVQRLLVPAVKENSNG